MPATATPHIVRLTPALADDPARYGGKASGLLRLQRLGLPVPEAWVIPAVDAALPPAGLEAELASFWRAFRAAFPQSRLAVRSSAVAEDLADASFAGIYRTVLGVADEAGLVAAVAVCLAAVQGPEAQAYREKTGRLDRRMALVLQRLVAAEKAGVLLTVNPLHPEGGDLVVDASYGLGEAVVSGRAHPDHVVVRKRDGAVQSFTVGGKELEIVAAAGGTREHPVDAARREAVCLNAAEIRALWQLAAKVEGALGRGQDCEWAFEGGDLYVLQQRPIVGLPPEHPKNVHSRKFGDEYIAEYTLPLSYGVLMPWISEHFLMDFARRFGFAERLTSYPTLRHEGYAYVSGEYVVELMSAAPRALRKPEAIGWFGPGWNERIKAAPFRPAQLARMGWAGLTDPLSSATKNRAALERHCADVESRLRPLLVQDYTTLPGDEWERQFAAGMSLGDAHFQIIRWGMGFLNPVYHSLLQERLAVWIGDDGAVYRSLIAGLPTKTSEVNRALWDLSRKAQADARIAGDIAADVPLGAMRAGYPDAPFWGAFDAFLSAYGHRGATRDIAVERWGERPDLVVGLVRAQLGEGAADPRTGEARAAARRREAEAQVAKAAAAWRRPVLKHLAAQAQAFTVYRENQRFYLDFVLYHLRRLVVVAGRRLAERGVLGAPDDVFFLDAAEFAAVRRGDAAAAAKVGERREHYRRWRDRLPATFLLDGVGVEPPPVHAAAAPGGLHGTPASPGVARGPVRVVKSVDELRHVRPGEILVAANTDPGWTSVFPLLAGLVTCTGGVLSHGALLAREYGIPAVTGVPRALERLATGDTVVLDAVRGTIEIVRP